ncbi:MAG: hypothetical protein DID92_2727744143 [Candidatus Nitrotoga sp. SPKER]|nr:MAG: hypothetical protein DID92_2727744143 [Candidatus Nitrotoga sp. SPKER]
MKKFESSAIGLASPTVAALGAFAKPRLIDQVAAVLNRLADAGWADLFATHGLDIRAVDLAEELARPVSVDRTASGFEDYAHEGCRGIEPGKPALSLVYHALASPRVIEYVDANGAVVPMREFPSLADIEWIEDYVYSTRHASLEDLRVLANGAHLAIVVYALEYRPAIGTVHSKHADLCFSRTGIARIGSEPARYLPEARGFLPFADDDHAVRVLPCRYAAFIAALVPGRRGEHGPLRFLEAEITPSAANASGGKEAGLAIAPTALQRRVADSERKFWIPLHKLFEGDECLRGRSLGLRLSANHRNEKIRRAHLRFLSLGHFGGWLEPDLKAHPFVITDGIAAFGTDAKDGSWLVVPQHRPRLVEPAEYKGKPLTYNVPKTDLAVEGTWRAYQSSLNLLPQVSGARNAPEYLHARHMMMDEGTMKNLNHEPGIVGKVNAGDYRALHYVDYTGDGWIDVECPELALEVPRRLPAYSIVSSPDFFPHVDQAALLEWTERSVQPTTLKILWSAPGVGRPEPLSDQRYAANLQLPGASFDPADDTMTAIVGGYGSGQGDQTRLDRPRYPRASTLPDGAAGVFAPGWDTSYDRQLESDADDTGDTLKPGVTFLTNYGLGSPFPEDSMLCAALSSFWPAVAPDITRTFAPGRSYATATPLTDEAIGLGAGEPWDGIRGPVVDRDKGVVEYKTLAYGDYVEAALNRNLNYGAIAHTTRDEYVARTLTMALVYNALGVETNEDKTLWSVLSFRSTDPKDPEYQDALAKTGRILSPEFAYRFELFKHFRGEGTTSPDPAKFDRRVLPLKETAVFYADPSIVLAKDGEDWTVHELRR